MPSESHLFQTFIVKFMQASSRFSDSNSGARMSPYKHTRVQTDTVLALCRCERRTAGLFLTLCITIKALNTTTLPHLFN